MIYRAIFASPVGRRLILLLAAMTVAILVTTYGQIILNRWNQPFYDAITRRDLNAFLYQLGVYFAIVGSLLVLDVAQRWLNETIQLSAARGSDARSARALDGCRAARSGSRPTAVAIGVNPDQRMTDDATKLCDISTDLSIGLFRSTRAVRELRGRALDDFARTSRSSVGGVEYAVPGFMLWAAISYAVVGSLLSYVVGRSLSGSTPTATRARPTCASRSSTSTSTSTASRSRQGEADERRRAEMHLGNVMIAMRRLVRGAHQSHLGDGRIRLDHGHRADPDRRAAVFQRARPASAA